jgi:hypothetical protein
LKKLFSPNSRLKISVTLLQEVVDMKKIRLVVFLPMIIVSIASVAHADLDGFLRNVNVQARSDIKNFNIKLSAQFGVPVPQVDAIIKRVPAPADAFMVLQLGQMANRPPEVVLETYQRSRGKGWGELAKELGIKPGSAEFHALKRGDLSFTGEPGGGEHGKGKGRGKGHNR